MSMPIKSIQTNPYALLRAALALFKKTPDELQEAEIRQAEIQAINEFKIENRVLNAPEAGAVIISDKELEAAYQEIRDRVNVVMELIASRAPDVNEVEIGIYYHLHPEQFNRPELREACHIFISINPDYPENTRETALSRMQEISAKLHKKPYKFAELALKHSECPTALQGGVLGIVPRGKLYPELDAVLFSIKAGEISEIVESEIGFHLVLCKQIQRAETLSLQKATPKIRQIMKERSRRTCQRAWLASLPQ
ncbi:MAG: nitrogen fixation protein NifM [Methylococcaceae bacterium]|nr:nitrogen fixation protein NifM [Methylococcaceae bacterium]